MWGARCDGRALGLGLSSQLSAVRAAGPCTCYCRVELSSSAERVAGKSCQGALLCRFSNRDPVEELLQDLVNVLSPVVEEGALEISGNVCLHLFQVCRTVSTQVQLYTP